MTRPAREPLADSELEAIRNEMDKTTNGGRDETMARQLSDAYVADHPTTFTAMEDMYRNDQTGAYRDLVASVSEFRQQGRFEDQWKVEAFLLSRVEKPHIGGGFTVKARIPTR